jgi:hypothetical protein
MGGFKNLDDLKEAAAGTDFDISLVGHKLFTQVSEGYLNVARAIEGMGPMDKRCCQSATQIKQATALLLNGEGLKIPPVLSMAGLLFIDGAGSYFWFAF